MLVSKTIFITILVLVVGCSGKNVAISYDGVNKPVSMSRAVYDQFGEKISTNELFKEKELKIVDSFSYQQTFSSLFYESSGGQIKLADAIGNKINNGDVIINLKISAIQQGPMFLLPFLSTETKVELKGDIAVVADNDGIYGEITSKNVIFVVDVSGSMDTAIEKPTGGTVSRLEYLKPRLVETIESLSSDVSFNIMFFSNSLKFWKTELTLATPQNKQDAKNIIMNIRSDGGTASMKAIQSAFSLSGVDTIYFLSDGEPTDLKPQTIIQEVERMHKLRPTIINSIVFIAGQESEASKDKAKSFMKSLAAITNGGYEIFE